MRVTSRLFHLVTIAALAWAPVAAAGPSGAVFTTDEDGTFVNANVYDAEGDAYLNGGPRANAPCTAARAPRRRLLLPGHGAQRLRTLDR